VETLQETSVHVIIGAGKQSIPVTCMLASAVIAQGFVCTRVAQGFKALATDVELCQALATQYLIL
jgi:hypothetical protein